VCVCVCDSSCTVKQCGIFIFSEIKKNPIFHEAKLWSPFGTIYNIYSQNILPRGRGTERVWLNFGVRQTGVKSKGFTAVLTYPWGMCGSRPTADTWNLLSLI
jgi:hypothetical protein